MEWQIGRRSGRVRYDRVRAVRLSYRPVTMQTHRFIAEIWSADNPKIQIVSVSWRSIMEQERLDKAYSAFVTELHRRVSAAGAAAKFTTGLPVVNYWVGVVIFSGVYSRPAACSCARSAPYNGRPPRSSGYSFWCLPISSALISIATGRAAIVPTRSPQCVAENLRTSIRTQAQP